MHSARSPEAKALQAFGREENSLSHQEEVWPEGDRPLCASGAEKRTIAAGRAYVRFRPIAEARRATPLTRQRLPSRGRTSRLERA
jgi:hypothetical protein